jgi:hypothetical protein
MKILDAENEFADHFKKLSEKCFTWRGTVLDKCIFLERVIDNFIALYFNPDEDKAYEMVELLISKRTISVENKRRILDVIINKSEPEFLKSYPNYFKDLEIIYSFRNNLSHNMLDTTGQGIDIFLETGTIRFMEFKKKLEFVSITDKEYVEKITLIEKYMNAFRLLLEKKQTK